MISVSIFKLRVGLRNIAGLKSQWRLFSSTVPSSDFESGDYGPRDPAMWCSGQLGVYRDAQCRYYSQGTENKLRFPTIAVNFSLKPKGEIDLKRFKEAIRATIYNNPELRVRFNLSVTPGVLEPVRDFSSVLEFSDLSEQGSPDYEFMTQVVEQEYQKGWDLDSEKGLNRWVLVKVRDYYYLIVLMHHGAHDGLSVIYTAEEIFKQYDRLCAGKPALIDPVKPSPLAEQLLTHRDDKLVEELVNFRVEHYKNYSCYVEPVNLDEFDENLNSGKPVLETQPYFGTMEEAKAISRTCKEINVSVGAMSMAASFMAIAVTYKNRPNNKFDEEGIHDSMLMSVSTRPDVNIPNFMKRAGFHMTNLFIFQKVTKDDTLFDIARSCNSSLKASLKRKEHLLHNQLKDKMLEHGFRNTRPDGGIAMHISNLGNLDYITTWNWGQVEWITMGGELASNPLGIMQGANVSTVKGLCMDAFYFRGENNSRNGRAFWNAFKAIFRGSGSKDGDLTVQQMIEKYKI